MPVLRLAADRAPRGVSGRFFNRYVLTSDQRPAGDAVRTSRGEGPARVTQGDGAHWKRFGQEV